MAETGLRRAGLLALLLPAGLLGGALISQYVFGLPPCEMCHWQRWPHYAALLPAIAGLTLGGAALRRTLIAIAALLIATSGAIGVFHAGVEYGWWQGLTACASAGPMTVDDIMNAPLVRCDAPAWTLAGISLAGFNAFFSLVGAAVILSLLFARPTSPA
ncbi:MAG: disulfide bond formation protein B [Sphingopyxis sp.]|nr:disulfide bond formation protein B [Sphingopyxis sp.]